MGGAGIERHDGCRVPAPHAFSRRQERAPLARRRAGHPKLPARRRQLGDVPRRPRRRFHQHRMLFRAQARRRPTRRAAPGAGPRVHPRARRHRPGADLHPHLARAVRPVELGRAADHAAGADVAAPVRAAEHLPVFLLGSGDHRAPPAPDGRPSCAPGARFGAPRRAARRRCGSTRSARRDRSAVPRHRRRVARLRPPPVPSLSRARPEGSRTVDPRPPGSGRQLGRNPAPVGLFADGAARARASAGPSRAEERPSRDARALDAPARRRKAAGAGVPVAGLGHRSLAARARRVGRAPVGSHGAAGGALAVARGDPRSGRLVRAGRGGRTERVGIRVRERSLPRRGRYSGRPARLAQGGRPGRRDP